MTDEQRDAEIEKHMGFIGQEARKKISLAKSTGYEYHDLINVGVLGLMHAIDKFDPDHESGANLLTYAKYWITQRITNAAREKDKIAKASMSIHTPIDVNGDVVTILELLTKKASESEAGKGMDKEYDKKYLHNIINSDLLSPMEKTAIQLRFFEGKKMREIDAVLQKKFRDKARAFAYINSAKIKLKNHLTHASDFSRF